MGCIRDILRSRVVDLAQKNQSPQSPEFPIFRSSLVPSVADYFRQCIGDKSATLESGHILFEMLDKKSVWKTSKFETFGNLHPTNKKQQMETLKMLLMEEERSSTNWRSFMLQENSCDIS